MTKVREYKIASTLFLLAGIIRLFSLPFAPIELNLGDIGISLTNIALAIVFWQIATQETK